jgi:hypothetical protein
MTRKLVSSSLVLAPALTAGVLVIMLEHDTTRHDTIAAPVPLGCLCSLYRRDLTSYRKRATRRRRVYTAANQESQRGSRSTDRARICFQAPYLKKSKSSADTFC